jgi:hypothetical protein
VSFVADACSFPIRGSVTLFTMPGKRAFEEQVAALDALRQQPAENRIAPLRKALGHRNNFIVGKAADLIREFGLTDFTSDMLAAFDRFFDDPVKSDPQCWAKNAISRTLAAMELQDEAVFLRGMRHIQMEPVWGGSSDTAGTLRATCALALVQCRSLTERDLLAHLIELLADKDKTVRIEVVRGIEQVGSPSAALLLRLRAVLGSENSGADEPEVLGACYGGILRIEGLRAIPWVRCFLAAADDNCRRSRTGHRRNAFSEGVRGPAGSFGEGARSLVSFCSAFRDRPHAPGCSFRASARTGPQRNRSTPNPQSKCVTALSAICRK